jgi:hypothetical protein
VIVLLFSQVLTLQEEKDGRGQEFSQGGFLVLLLWGELEALGLKGLELVSKLRATPVTHPDVDSHEKGLCVKIVEGCSRLESIAPPLFSHRRGWGQVAQEGLLYPEGFRPPAPSRFTRLAGRLRGRLKGG